MRLAPVNHVKRTRRNITVFGGLDRTPNASGTLIGSMMNMTSDEMPSLSSRPPRGYWTPGESSDGCTVNGNMILVDDTVTAAALVNGSVCITTQTDIYADGEKADGDKLNGFLADRVIVPFGQDFFVVPDGLYVRHNPLKGYTADKCPKKFSSASAVTVNAVKGDSTPVLLPYSADYPVSPEENESFIKTQGDEAYIYTLVGGSWEKGERVYPSFAAEGIGLQFSQTDRVVLKKAYAEDIKRTVGVISVSADSLVLDAPFKGNLTRTGFSVERYFPLMDFAVESNNRIWGCRYGFNVFGDFVNEIYASSLGDPMNWDCIEGISSDSYTASLGSSGQFTGAASLGGRPVFFKEKSIITIGGTSPQSFTVNSVSAPGVETSSAGSLVNMNETLYYKSTDAIVVYDGTSVRSISEKLGRERFYISAAGGVNGKYRAVFNFADGSHSQYVYDSEKDVWHVEDDDENALFFVPLRNSLISVCLVNYSSDGEVEGYVYRFYADNLDNADIGHSIFSGIQSSEFSYRAEKDVDFLAETRSIYAYTGSEAVRSVVIRAEKEENAVLKVGVVFGDNDEYKEVCCLPGYMTGAFSVPVNTPRCSEFRLRFSGRGRVKILSVGIITERTSEVNGYGI